MTWEIVVGLSVLVGFFIAILTPIIKLNTSITKLNCSIDELNRRMASSDKQTIENTHRLDDHEKRIIKLETKGE